MSAPQSTVRRQLENLITWERRKHNEQSILISAGAALASAIVLLPLPNYLPLDGLRWFMPVFFMLLIAPWLLRRRRWRDRDSARALVRLDKTLDSAERATSAWEFSADEPTRAAHQLIFKQAHERMSGFDARRQFPRHWQWPSYAAGPLLVLWLALLWFEVDRALVQQNSAALPSLAYKLGEFSRELKAKAKSEGLSESLKVGQELEKVARESIAGKRSDEQLKRELAGMAQKLERAAKSGSPESFTAGESQQALQDLKAEVEAARDLFNLAESAKPNQALPPQWMDRLAALPQLKRQLDKGSPGAMGGGASEMRSFLDRLEREATGELDRRTLLDAQEFLERLAESGQNRRQENDLKMAGRGDREGDGEGAEEKKSGSLPGKEPGKQDGASSLPQFRGGAPTQVKGSLGEGDSSAVELKGKPVPGKSQLGEENVTAHYRRQAEQELHSERVPEALKETIRNYFLSLEEGKRR